MFVYKRVIPPSAAVHRPDSRRPQNSYELLTQMQRRFTQPLDRAGSRATGGKVAYNEHNWGIQW